MRYLDSTLSFSEPVIGPPNDFSSAKNAEAISEMAQSDPVGIYEKYKDCFLTMDIAGYGTRNFRLVGTCQNNLASGGLAGLTFMAENPIGVAHMNDGTTTTGGYYQSGKLVQNHLASIFTAIPQEWQGVIKTVSKQYGTSQTGKSTMTCQLCVPSKYEIGLTTSSGNGYWSEPNCGQTYRYFSGEPSSGSSTKRVRKNNDTAILYWTRSISYSNGGWFVVIYSDGSTVNNQAKLDSWIIPIFCI